jgi:hypothetical protein
MLSFTGKWMELENIILSEVSLAKYAVDTVIIQGLPTVNLDADGAGDNDRHNYMIMMDVPLFIHL